MPAQRVAACRHLAAILARVQEGLLSEPEASVTTSPEVNNMAHCRVHHWYTRSLQGSVQQGKLFRLHAFASEGCCSPQQPTHEKFCVQLTWFACLTLHRERG